MYRIAICEDNPQTSGSIEQILLDYAQSILLKIVIEVFYSAEEFLVNSDKYDIIFIDIKLKELNGIELGSLIRKHLKDNSVKIVFISAYTDNYEEIFEADPQYFIPKPISKEKLIHVFQRMIDKYESNIQDFFVYKVGREIYRVPVQDIIYFRVKNRTIYIKTVAKEDFYAGTLNKVRDQLKDNNFFMANRNFFVNYKYISWLSTHEIYLSTNETITLGYNKYKELAKQQAKMQETAINQHLVNHNVK